MADLADCMDALALIAEGACYPNGTSSPSVTARPIDIAQGWPMVEDLDAALKAGRSMVTVYAVPGTTSVFPTPFNFDAKPVSAPSYGIGADGDADGFALWGRPNVGEYATVLVDLGRAYSYAAEPGDLVETMMAFITSAIAQDYPGTTFDGSAVRVVGAKSLTVRIGAPALLGEVIGRQRQMFRVTAWCPNPADRATIGRALNVAVRQNLRIPMPDGSDAFANFSRDDLSDERQNVMIYRRDIVTFVQWDTLDLIPAYEVTAVTVDFKPGQGALQRAR